MVQKTDKTYVFLPWTNSVQIVWPLSEVWCQHHLQRLIKVANPMAHQGCKPHGPSRLRTPWLIKVVNPMAHQGCEPHGPAVREHNRMLFNVVTPHKEQLAAWLPEPEFYSFLPVTLGKQLIQELRSLVLFSLEHDPFISQKNQTVWSEEAPPSSPPAQLSRRHCYRQAKPSVSGIFQSCPCCCVRYHCSSTPIYWVIKCSILWHYFLLPFFDLIYLGYLFISVYKELPSRLSHCMDIQLFI